MEMMTVAVPLVLLIGWFVSPFCESKLVQDEVAALQQIAHTMGSRYWVFDDSSCQVKMVGLSSDPPMGSNSTIECDCNFENNACHVVGILLKGFSLPGTLPPELAKLPHLRYIDFAYNYLSGDIPKEWASLQLEKISLIVNRLSGKIPTFVGSMTNLTYLSLENNQFSGNIPAELGQLTNLETLVLSSNQFTGTLPSTLQSLKNLSDFRINDNKLNGTIPSYIGSWKQLKRLEMHASGLTGPIPNEISYLENLTQLRISDINGTTEGIPMLRKMGGLEILVLRNCKIYGEIPTYLWNMENLHLLDLSFNKLVGEIPNDITAKYLKVVYLSGNYLSGDIPSTMLNSGSNIDLSYNNFTWQNPKQPSCQANLNLNINLFKSSSASGLRRILPCLDRVHCPRYECAFHINAGGDDSIIKGDEGKVLYEGDASAPAGSAIYFKHSGSNWGFSSFGDFMDDNNLQNIRHITSLASSNLSTLYKTARLTPISLAYFGYCLKNGKYTVTLHFAEIQFSNDNKYASLGKRIFDIFIQDKLVEKNFNIEDVAHGAQKPFFKKYTASVTDGSLEIRFYWAGKGTTRVPNRGVYGPLVSAISVTSSDFKQCSNGTNRRMLYIISGVAGFCLVILASFLLWWKRYMVNRSKAKVDRDHSGSDVQNGGYTLKQIKDATNNFDSVNKLGEGGFGAVYKGLLPNGNIIAVKQSFSSKQGDRQFLNEIAMISCLQHPNLVKLHGCCTEGNQLLLVYEYMENNSLACSLFASEGCILNWPTRVKIMLGVARGLAFLNEESRLKIVHRDIKATNVLLDKDFNAKIADFGLARLGDEDKTHINTGVAGTIGYMAPEYALWGYLTNKADVYSFGILALEIVSGKSNNHFAPPGEFFCLLDWACHLQQTGNYTDFVDEKLGSEVNMEEAERMVKVALLCTNGSPSMRPAMSEVVRMLEGETDVPEAIPEAGTFSDDLRFKAMRDICKNRQEEESNSYHNSNSILTDAAVSSTFSASVST